MKAIKIDSKNRDAIEAALEEANSPATAHTYNRYIEVASLANAAENKLTALGIPMKDRKGATWVQTSGSAVSKSYTRLRYATGVELERRATGWFLTNVWRAHIYHEGGGRGRLTLTTPQAVLAHSHFAQQFSIAND